MSRVVSLHVFQSSVICIISLEHYGLDSKQSGELAYNLVELDNFASCLKDVIGQITRLKKSDRRKLRKILDMLSEEIEYHILPNHIIPLKRLLRRIEKSN